jgi:hypothetical protein
MLASSKALLFGTPPGDFGGAVESITYERLRGFSEPR